MEPGRNCRNPAAWVAVLFAVYGRDPTIDQTFIRHMSTHHEQEILLASMAAERAGDPTGPLFLVASQRGEA